MASSFWRGSSRNAVGQSGPRAEIALTNLRLAPSVRRMSAERRLSSLVVLTTVAIALACLSGAAGDHASFHAHRVARSEVILCAQVPLASWIADWSNENGRSDSMLAVVPPRTARATLQWRAMVEELQVVSCALLC